MAIAHRWARARRAAGARGLRAAWARQSRSLRRRTVLGTHSDDERDNPDGSCDRGVRPGPGREAHHRTDARPLTALRMIAGLAVAPIAATLIALSTYDAFWHAGLFPDGAPLHSLDSAASLGTGIAILAVLTTAAAAVPGVMWLKRHGPLSLGRLMVLGALLGNVPFTLIIAGVVVTNAISGRPSPDFEGAPVRISLGVISGAGSAAVFWFVAVCGTADPQKRADGERF